VADYSMENVSADPFLNWTLNHINKTFGLPEEGYNLDKLWLVETRHSNVDMNELPYIPHIDYKRYLKVMIYVDDVTENNGPFSAISTNPKRFEKNRLSLKSDYKKDKRNRVDFLPMEEFKSFTAPRER